MKVKITQKGVFVPGKGKGQPMQELEVGHVMEVAEKEVPAFLIGKCEVMDKPAPAGKRVNNTDEGEGDKKPAPAGN